MLRDSVQDIAKIVPAIAIIQMVPDITYTMWSYCPYDDVVWRHAECKSYRVMDASTEVL